MTGKRGVRFTRATEEIKNEARILRTQGWSYQRIGEKLGYGKGTVANWLDPSRAERAREASERWIEQNPERSKNSRNESSSAWKERNPDQVKLNKRNWFENNREHVYELARDWRLKNPERNRENQRRWRERDQENRSPSVYAVLFPTAGILKIGKIKRRTSDARNQAMRRMRNRGFYADDALVIWEDEGQQLEEAYLQISMAFYFQPAFSSSRLSEWFKVNNSSQEEIGLLLNEFYSIMPECKWNAEASGDDR